MKITKLSLAAIAAMTITTGAMAESTWDFKGQGVGYTQTIDQSGNGDLFGSDSTYSAVGLQLGGTTKSLIGGVGAGVEVSGIHNDDQTGGFYVSGGDAGTTSGGVTQAYLTYGMANTSFKVGRQQLPKSLSPFAFSEGWNMFKNTFDAARVVNTDIKDTTLVYAFVKNGNRSIGAYANEDSFAPLADDGVHMLTASTKAISGITLTGSAYQAGNDTGDTTMLWADAKAKFGPVGVALQAGQVSPDGSDDTTAVGAKVSGKVSMFNLSLAHTQVSKGTANISNATGIKSPLYTQMVLNNVGQYHAAPGSEFTKLFATTKAGGGTVKAGYGLGTNSNNDATEFSELDLMYVKKLNANTKLFVAYIMTNNDDAASTLDGNNFVRVWGRYSF